MSLRDRFFCPADVVADLQRVRTHLLDPAAPDEERSHGEVTGSDLLRRYDGVRRPARDGIFCQKIFGPTTPFRCACGALFGEAHAGASCERCGVLCASPALRDRRYGHIVVSGVLHPALVSNVAAVLRLPTDAVSAIARCSSWLDGDTVRSIDDLDVHDPASAGVTGPAALQAALERAGADAALIDVVITRAVPLPPSGLRPFVGGLGAAMVDPWIGPVNEAWYQLLLAARQQLRLVELSAPRIILLNAQGVVQELFETIVAMTASPPVVTRLWPVLQPPSSPVRLVGAPGRLPEGIGSAVAGLIFVDDDRLLVQRPQGSWLVTTRGAVLAHFPSCGRIATSVHGQRLRLAAWMQNDWDWFEQDAYWDAISGRASIAVLDLAAGDYLDTYPADLPLRLLSHLQPEELVPDSVAAEQGAEESRAASRPPILRWGGDRPAVLAGTRDGRYAWVGDENGSAILDLDTGVPQLDPVMESEVDENAPIVRLVPDADDVRDVGDPGETALAMGLTAQNRFRLLHGSGVVSDGERALFRIDAMIDAAAFSPTADRIAIATEGEIVLVAMSDTPAVIGRFAAPNDT